MNEIKFGERKSNKELTPEAKRRVMNRVELRLLAKLRETLNKLKICKLYEYDTIDLNLDLIVKL